MRARWVPAIALAVVIATVSALARSGPEPSSGQASSLRRLVGDPDRYKALSIEGERTPESIPGEVEIAAPDQFDGPAPPETPPPAALTKRFAGVVPKPGTWAVVIGINDYPGSRSDLRSAVADAADVDAALAAMAVPPGNRLTLVNGQATASTVKRAAEWLVAHAGPDAVAVFFYAGHVRKLSSGRQVMVTANGSTVSDLELRDALAPLQARRAWIGMAACYGGGFDEVLAPGRVLHAAAPADKLAYENAALGRSYMVHYMIREAFLENRANASVQAAFTYARAEIAQTYPGREPVEIDYGGGVPLSLRQPASGGPPPVQHKSPPATQPPPSPQRPPSGGGGGGGATTTSTPPKCGGVSNPLLKCADPALVG